MMQSILFFTLVLSVFAAACWYIPIIAAHFTACLILSLFDNRARPYALESFVAYDQLFNVIFAPVVRRIFGFPIFDFGHADETVSSVLGKNILLAPNHCTKGIRLVDMVLSRIDPRSRKHCVDSIEFDEGDL